MSMFHMSTSERERVCSDLISLVDVGSQLNKPCRVDDWISGTLKNLSSLIIN